MRYRLLLNLEVDGSNPCPVAASIKYISNCRLLVAIRLTDSEEKRFYETFNP